MRFIQTWLLKRKVARIEAALRRLTQAAGVTPMVWSYGAYYINPRHLVFIVGVPTDRERERLRSDETFQCRMRGLLVQHEWPQAARPQVFFEIESQETVDRDSQGNWWHHFK